MTYEELDIDPSRLSKDYLNNPLKHGDKPTKEELEYLYLELNLPMLKIAEVLGTTRGAIDYNLGRYKIKKSAELVKKQKAATPRKYSYIKKEVLYDLFITKNLSGTEIGAMLHIPGTCLRRLFKKYNLQKTPEQFKAMQIRVVNERYAKRTEEERQHKVEACRRAWYNQSEEELAKRIEIFSRVNSNRTPEHQAKLVTSWKKHLANETPEEKAKRIQNVSKGTKVAMSKIPFQKRIEMRKKSQLTRKNQSEESKKRTREKYNKTWSSKSEAECKYIISKGIETKRKNGTLCSSGPEKRVKALLESKFKEVKYQYKSEKYPFVCDFYIPELDLYIEYQGLWTHGLKPFEGTGEDLQKVEFWKNKKTKYYAMAIDTWTRRDVKKRKLAKESNLNWLEFFNMQQFIEWFDKL